MQGCARSSYIPTDIDPVSLSLDPFLVTSFMNQVYCGSFNALHTRRTALELCALEKSFWFPQIGLLGLIDSLTYLILTPPILQVFICLWLRQWNRLRPFPPRLYFCFVGDCGDCASVHPVGCITWWRTERPNKTQVVVIHPKPRP